MTYEEFEKLQKRVENSPSDIWEASLEGIAYHFSHKGFKAGLAARAEPKYETFEEWEASFNGPARWNYDEEQLMKRAWEASRQ